MKAKLNIWKYTISVILYLFISSCGIVVEDKTLEDERIILLSPPDNYQTDVVTQNFWWDKIDKAARYNLQIVIPDFNTIQSLVLDTTVSTTKVTYTLNPGNTYQWRVRGENNAYSTPYATRTITIDSSADLSQQVVVLLSPADNYATNNTNLTLKWETIYNADEYRLQIGSPDINTIIVDVTQLGDTFKYTFTEGDYQWQVRAQNSGSNSPYTTRSFTVDLTAPTAPNLLSPTDGSIEISPTVTLLWSRDATALGDSLFVLDLDSALISIAFPFFTTDTTYNYSGISGDTLLWKVQSVDQAGNGSSYSVIWKFIIQ